MKRLSPGSNRRLFIYTVLFLCVALLFVRSQLAATRKAASPLQPIGAKALETTLPVTPSSPLLTGFSGTYTVGTGATYTTLKAFFDAVNGGVVTGNITVNITGNSTETATASLNQWTEDPAGSNFTMLIQPVGARTITGSLATAIIKLNGADRVTIDGLNSGGNSLSVTNNSTSNRATGIWLASLGAGQGATNNTIRNLTITGGSIGTNSIATFGIIVGSTIIDVNTFGDDNDNTTIQGNTITKVQHGIFVEGNNVFLQPVTSTGGDDNLVITGNTVGPATAGANNIGATGIYVQDAISPNISNNTVRNVVCPTTFTFQGWPAGISLLNATDGVIANNIVTNVSRPGTTNAMWVTGILSETNATNTQLTGNTVSTITATATSTSGNVVSAYGIISGGSGARVIGNTVTSVSAASTSGNPARGIWLTNNNNVTDIKLINNSVSDIVSFSFNDTLFRWQPVGIYIDPFMQNLKLYNNSVNLFGSHAGVNAATQQAAVFIDGSGTETGLDLRNNIFVNTYNNSTSASDKSYAIYTNASASAFTNLNYNDYYVSGTPGVLGFSGADQTTIAAWRTATGQDLQSFSADPLYTSTTNLHISSASSPVSNTGTPITGVTTDIDGDTRNATTPDVGADEFSAGSLQFSSATYTDSETNSDHIFNVTVTRTGGTLGAVSVDFAVTDGTATVAGNDYTASPASGTLNWSAGDSTPKTITITVKGDTTPEPDETVNFALTNAQGGATLAAPSAAVLTITNDDISAETDASVSGGVLTVSDGNGGASNDALTISLAGTNVRINDPNNTLGAGAGATQVDANTVDVPLASLTGIQVNTLGGNDTLTLNLANGNFIPAGGLAYAGGSPTSAPGDKLVIMGGSQGMVTYSYTNAHDGSIIMSNFGTVSYTGLEPITNTGSATDIVFNLPAGPNNATLADDGTSGNTLSRLTGSTFETTDFANPTGSLTINRGSASDTFATGALPDFNASLTIGSGANPFATVFLNGALTLFPDKNLAVDSSNISGQPAAVITASGTGAITLNAGQNITTINGCKFSVVNGNLTFNGNTAGAAGTFPGVSLSGAFTTSGTGNIAVTGKGGAGAGSGSRPGIFIVNGGTATSLTSTSTAPGAGTITLNGTGGQGTTSMGVIMGGAGTSISSVVGDISITGQGGNGTGAGNTGVQIENGGVISSTGAAKITLNGAGGHGTQFNIGVELVGPAVSITSATGDISITGQGGTGTSSSNYGVQAESGSVVSSTGTAKITINGTGGTAGTASSRGVGVRIGNDTTQVTSSGGDISITGQGANGGSSNFGISIAFGGRVFATGGAKIIMNGTAGTGTSSLSGVIVSSFDPTTNAPSTVTSDSGDISITGQGGNGTSLGNIGINTDSSARIVATGTAGITLNGTGGKGSSDCYGVGFEGGNKAGTAISAAGGNISITGTGGNSPGTDMDGVRFEDSVGAQAVSVTTTGTGTLTITGTAGNTDPTSAGLNVVEDTTMSLGGATNTFIADTMDFGTSNISINAGGNTLALRQKSNGKAIDLGGADSTTQLGLTDAELGLISAGTLSIGDSNSGAISVSTNVTRAAATNLNLTSGANIDITGGSLNSAGGNVSLTPNTNVFPGSSGVDVNAGTGTLTLASNKDLKIVINNTMVDTGYTQLGVAGLVNLNNANLSFAGSTYTPAGGDSFVIVNNDGADSITGTFNGLPEGATIPNFLGSGLNATITYTGGDGNDAVITVVPATPVTISIDNVTVSEGGGSALFTVTQSVASGTNTTFTYSTADGSATAGSDYTGATNAPGTITAGSTTTTITIPILQDSVYEGTETFTVTLNNAVNATIGTGTGTGTITDDDAPPAFSINDVMLAEGNSGTTAFTFTITKTGATTVNATVNYSTADGTASAPSDYTSVASTPLTFAPADTSMTVTVLVNGDTTVEPDETFFVNLSGGAGATIADGQGLGTITNDDTANMNGTKTVCASGCDYTSLTGSGGLFAAINSAILTGNVTATVGSDLVEDGTVALNQWTESGAGNYSLTIQPADATLKTISGNVDDAAGMIRLNGADRVTIDGRFSGGDRFLAFRNTSLSSPVIALSGDASNNTIRSAVIEGATASSTNGVLFFGTGTTTGNDDNLVTDNQIRDRSDAPGVPAYLIFSQGTSSSVANSNNTISDNQLFNFTSGAINLVEGNESWTISGNTISESAVRTTSLTGIQFSGGGTNSITHNTVRDLNTSASSTGLALAGAGNTTVSRNRLYSFQSVAGSTGQLTGISFSGGGASSATLVNNQLTLMPSFTNDQSVRGIVDDGASGSTLSIDYNSVLLGGTAAGTGQSWALLRTMASASTATLRDNILFNNRTGGTGSHFAAGNQSSNGAFSSDFNLFVGTGSTTATAFFDSGSNPSGTPVTFAQWQSNTGGDAHSNAGNTGGAYSTTLFVDPTVGDLHLNSSADFSTLALVSNTGAPVGGITTDYDDETRDAATPDIGSDEIATPTGVATTLVVAPASGPYGGTVNLSATLKQGTNNLSGESVSFTLNGNNVGSAVTDSSGVATLSNVSLAGIDPGTYPNGVGARFAGDGFYQPTSGSNSLTVLSAVLNISMTADRNPAIVGLNFNYKPVITNTGNEPATNVILTDVLPSQVTLTAVTSSQGTCSYTLSTHTVTCSLGTIAAGSSVNVQITVKPRQEGTLDDTATVTMAQPNPPPGNNSVSVNGLTAIKLIDLSISKIDSLDPIFVSQQTTYTITVKNNSTVAGGTGVTATDTLPAALKFVSATTSQGSLVTPPVGASGVVTANLGSLAAGATATVTVTVTASAAGLQTNTVTVSGNEQDPNSANNTVSQATTVKDATLQKVLLTKQVLTGGCENTTGNVYLTGPAPVGGLTVNLLSDMSGATVPASVFIPAGQTVSPTFTVTTTHVTAKQQGLITGTLGTSSVSRNLTINVGSGTCPP